MTLNIKQILCDLPYDTAKFKSELYAKGFPNDLMYRLWNGKTQKIDALNAEILVDLIREKGRELKQERGIDNKYIDFKIADLYVLKENQSAEPKSSITRKSLAKRKS